MVHSNRAERTPKRSLGFVAVGDKGDLPCANGEKATNRSKSVRPGSVDGVSAASAGLHSFFFGISALRKKHALRKQGACDRKHKRGNWEAGHSNCSEIPCFAAGEPLIGCSQQDQ